MLTVLLATLNRAAILRQVLDNFCKLEWPEGGWKLVIVDNGSTDGTESVIREYQDRLPVTYVRENTPGKNAALNTGLKYIEGDIVIFTDDDISPPPGWLKVYRKVLDEQPGFTIFGGPETPKFPHEPEPWVTADPVITIVCFACSDPALKTGPTSSFIVGGNLAVRASVFHQGYRYDTTIGPDGTQQYAMGSEAELLDRLTRDGHKRWWIAENPVHHIVRPEQLTWHYMLGRATRWGRGTYRLREPAAEALVFGFPRWVFRQMLRHTGALVKERIFGTKTRYFYHLWYWNYYKGFLLEAAACKRKQRRPGLPASVDTAARNTAGS
jgi:glycosyltransferase involved in cell wall biosynthesis